MKMFFITLMFLTFFQLFICEIFTNNTNTNIHVNTTLEVIVPVFVYEFELENTDKAPDFLKWVSLYKYKEDNSYLIEINSKKRLSSSPYSILHSYEKTEDGIIFNAKDFQSLYLILSDPEKIKWKIIGLGYEINVLKHLHPFQIIIYKKSGFWKEEKVRGFTLDHKEFRTLLLRSSQLMKDSNN